MEPLVTKIDEKKTLKAVNEHIHSFLKIRHLYTISEIDESDFIDEVYVQKKGKTTCSKRQIVKKICNVQSINKITKDYLDYILDAFNLLSEYDRKILLLKYFYEMDDEEMAEEIGYSDRKIRKDIRSAKLNLAFLLDCIKYVS